MKRGARITIDLDALTHNLSVVARTAPDSKIIAVIKANAYGHGMLSVARHLQDKVSALAVACVHEAMLLSEAGIRAPLIVLQGFHDQDQLQQCLVAGLQPVCHQLWQIDLLKQLQTDQQIDVWLKIDTGMNRLGLIADQAVTAFNEIMSLPAVRQVRIMSHFASADELKNPANQLQLAIFNQIRQQIDAESSMANSAAICTQPDSHFEWVRPGLMLYGVSPLENSDISTELKPVMTLSSQIIALKSIARGEAVGYGGSWVAEHDSLIAVAAIGYGDGYPRHAISGTPVLVNGERCHIAGRVSMDMIVIDISAMKTSPQIGDEVILWGAELAVEEVASCCDTIAYELLCAAGREQ